MPPLTRVRRAADALLDPRDPAVQDLLTRLDLLRRPEPAVRARVHPLVPRRRHRVAVVIPLHDYEDYVAASIRSAATQEGVDCQVVVVDDRSTDASYEVAVETAREHDNVLVLRNEVNRGHGQTFNRGWQAVGSDFVQRLDADDLLTPGALARAVAVAEAAPSAGLVYGHFREFRGEPPAPRVDPDPSGVVWEGRAWLRHVMAQDRNPVGTPAALMRTSLLREHGPWRAELQHSQDFEMWLRLATVSDIGRVAGADQALRRAHPVSMSTVGQTGTVNVQAHLDAYDAWYAQLGAGLPDGAELLALARRSVARRAMRTALHGWRRGRPEEVAAPELVELARSVDPGVGQQREAALLAAASGVLGARQARMPWALAGAIGHRLDDTVTLARHRRTGL